MDESGRHRLPEGVEIIDLAEVRSHAQEAWSFLPLTEVNGVRVSLSVVQGEYFAHLHEVDDEFYLVLEGRLVVEVGTNGRVELGPGQALRVPAQIRHKAMAPTPTVALNVKGFSGETVRLD